MSTTGDDLIISSFPDDIIREILSRLPTVDAVRTSVLSKDWEFRWTSIHSVDVEDIIQLRKFGPLFVKFMQRLLSRTGNYKSFKLKCFRKYHVDHMTEWISAALRQPDIENVNITYYNGYYNNIILPAKFLNGSSVRELVLFLNCTIKVPTEISFPYLTKLYFHNLRIMNKNSNSNDTLTFRFPVLRECTMVSVIWSGVKIVEIHAPQLITLDSHAIRAHGFHDYTIKIFADRLENFTSSSHLQENIKMMPSGSSIANASLYFDRLPRKEIDCDKNQLKDNGLKARNLLQQFSMLKYLRLSGFVAKAIAETELGLPYPIYYKLERIVMKNLISMEVLFELLHATPSLRSLYIQISEDDDKYEYDAIQHVPSCIKCSLEEVKFDDFLDKEHQYNLAKFLMKTGECLKTIFLHVTHAGRKYEISGNLLKFPCSSLVEIVLVNQFTWSGPS